MLSVLHILSSLELGGAERVTIALAQLQRQEKLDAQILCLGSENDFLVEEAKSHDIPVWFSESRDGRLRRYQKIRSILKRFDVIHVHSRGAFRFLSPLFFFFHRKKVIYTRHGLEPLDSLQLKLMYKLLQPFIDYVTFVTESGYEVFYTNHHWDRAKLRVIHNGVVVPADLSISSDYPIRFGSVGRMIPLKGQSILLDAIEILAADQPTSPEAMFRLNFFGSGPLESRLKSRAESIGRGLVQFFGEENKLESIYDNIDVLVVASETEGLSMVIIEAMARGKPVIATDVGGNPKLVLDNETGLIVPFGDPSSLSKAMGVFLENRGLIEKYGVASRRSIERNFSLSNTHKAYLDCYLK